MMTLLLVGLALQSLPNRWAENAKCEMRNAKCQMRNADRGMLPVTTEPKTSEAFDLLSLNFAHFREDSSRATEALPRRFRGHAHTPARRYDRHLWLRHAALSPSVQKIYS